MDDLKTCDRCGSDACYVQEINEKIKNYQCYGCGFITNSLLVKDTEFFEEQMELLPNLYKELMGEDEHGKIWMPSTVNMPTKGMIFANGKSIENWKWAAVLAIPVKDEEKEKYDSDHSLWLKFSLTFSTILILLYFIFPSQLIEVVSRINII